MAFGKGATVVGGQSTAASVTDTNIEIIGTTARLVGIDRLRVAQSTHKTSEQFTIGGQRMTTTGTGTAYTPILDEPGAGAIAGTAKVNDSVEPSYTSNTQFLDTAANSLPGRDIVLPPGKEIWVAPSSSAGVGFFVTTPSGTTTATYKTEAHMIEFG